MVDYFIGQFVITGKLPANFTYPISFSFAQGRVMWPPRATNWAAE
jgi:hypothetical protein